MNRVEMVLHLLLGLKALRALVVGTLEFVLVMHVDYMVTNLLNSWESKKCHFPCRHTPSEAALIAKVWATKVNFRLKRVEAFISLA